MKPEIDQILGTTAAQLMMQIAPQIPPGYTQSTAGLLSMILGFCAQEYENGADVRANENAHLRKLLAALEGVVQDSKLRVKLGAVMGDRDASLKISDLNASNAQLINVLIDAHTYLETRTDERGKMARDEVWNFLKARADQRLLKLPGM